MNNIKLYLIGVVVLLFVSLGYYAWDLWTDYQQLKFEKQISDQNNAALQDSLSKQAAKVTEIATFVRNLSSENSRLRNQNLAMRSDINVLIDSIRILKRATAQETDSTVKVEFKGEKSIVSYDGYTLYDKRTKSGTYSIGLAFKPIDVTSELFQEGTLWKIRTISRTDGVLVKGISTIDDDTYAKLQKYSPPKDRSFGAGLFLSDESIYAGAMVKKENWVISPGYRLLNPNPKWYQNVMLGLHYLFF